MMNSDEQMGKAVHMTKGHHRPHLFSKDTLLRCPERSVVRQAVLVAVVVEFVDTGVLKFSTKERAEDTQRGAPSTRPHWSHRDDGTRHGNTTAAWSYLVDRPGRVPRVEALLELRGSSWGPGVRVMLEKEASVSETGDPGGAVGRGLEPGCPVAVQVRGVAACTRTHVHSLHVETGAAGVEGRGSRGGGAGLREGGRAGGRAGIMIPEEPPVMIKSEAADMPYADWR